MALVGTSTAQAQTASVELVAASPGTKTLCDDIARLLAAYPAVQWRGCRSAPSNAVGVVTLVASTASGGAFELRGAKGNLAVLGADRMGWDGMLTELLIANLPPGSARVLRIKPARPELDGADAWVDGQWAGVLPLAIEVLPGKHLIRVSKPGYRTRETEADITAADVVHSVDLEEPRALLQVLVDPAAATPTIEVNGIAPTGPTSELAAGKYQIVAKALGYAEVRWEVEVRPGDLAVERIKLEPLRDFVTIPAGTYPVGCLPDIEPCWLAQRAKPVSITRPFSILRVPVTVEDYRKCVAKGACTAAASCIPGDLSPRQPMPCTTLSQAQAYCHSLDPAARVPTPTEWEIVARGGQMRLYPWGNTPSTMDTDDKPGEVGSHPEWRTVQGVFDMVGTHFEWTAEGTSVQTRGGPCQLDWFPTISSRFGANAEVPRRDVGFRCTRP